VSQNMLAATHGSEAWGVLQVSCLTTIVRSSICLPYQLSIGPGSSSEKFSVQGFVLFFTAFVLFCTAFCAELLRAAHVCLARPSVNPTRHVVADMAHS
jgi:hypothetical protein